MAHEIETMVYVRSGGVPWHGLGTPVEDAMDSEEALVKAGLAWAVDQRPVYVQREGTRLVRVPGVVANVRATDGAILGVVSDRYRIVQNREAFSFTDALLDHGARYETAGSLRGGRKVWLLARLPEVYKLIGDPAEVYVCFTNSHDGSGAVRAAVVPVRIVCRNTLNLALDKALRSWSTPHVGDMAAKLEEAKRALALARDYMRELQDGAEVLAAMGITSEQWTSMVEQLLPLPDGDKVQESTVERARQRQQDLYGRLFAPDLDPFRWTAWGAMNAVADFVGHADPIRSTSTFEERRFERVVDGHPMLDRALALLQQ